MSESGTGHPQGNVQDGAPDVGRSLKVGSIARDPAALPAAATPGSRIPILLDQFGRVIVTSAGGAATQIEGNVAHDAPDGTSNPVKTGGRANANPPAAVGENDRVNQSETLFGQLRSALSSVRLSDSVAGDVNVDTPASIDALAAAFQFALHVHDSSVTLLNTATGTTASAAVTDPTAAASVIAALKGILANSKVIAPLTGDSSNQAVTTLAVTTFTTTAGRLYLVSVTTEMTFLEATDPTATTGMILAPGTTILLESSGGGTFRLIATTVAGRASVVQVYP